MKAYLFDVDGVLSDPVEKQVTEIQLFDQIIIRLKNGSPVCLNTGRSTEWMMERFITHFVERINDKSILLNFIAIGEKGGTWITFDYRGEVTHRRMNDQTIPEKMINEVKELVEKKYKNVMFFDDTKETMLSVEMKDGFNLDLFHQKQKELVNEIVRLLGENNASDKYKIDPTTIATDIESLHVGKALGVLHFLRSLIDINISPDEFETFGDSRSDFEMSDELEKQGKSVRMIFVGDKNKLGEIHTNYQIDYVPGFSKGTLEYLQKEGIT